MRTSVTGFPRIGAKRELKFASEKYFRGEISEAQLQEATAAIRAENLRRQKEAGIDYIPSNDFSFYDGVLDTAALFGIVPERYQELGLSPLDTYFAMARGYQGEKGDVRALAMKKWYNTNYHYIVPELDDSTVIGLTGDKPFREYSEAKELGIETRPVITGAYTLLSLCRFTGAKGREEVRQETAAAYRALLRQFAELGTEWVQFDEPALVKDLTEEDIRLFRELYLEILEESGKVKVLLQTYFGDVRDVYRVLTELPFAGIGLDFIEGKRTAELIENEGFPEDKLLFAGLVNGKNIWRNHYRRTLDVLDGLRQRGIRTVVSTSCSLLHVPYTLDNEAGMKEAYRRHFAFAVQKLTELTEIGQLADCGERESVPAYRQNVSLFAEGRDCGHPEVKKRLAEITEEDYVRRPARSVRQKLQKEAFGLPIFPTTTIGSFPQTQDVKKNRSMFRKGEISEQAYKGFNRKKIERVVHWQEEIGLDVLVHGEYERNDMVEYFGEALSGYLFTEMGWVQSYGTRCVKPPVIWGDVSRSKPITVEWSVYAQSLTEKPLKGMLTGPVTIFNWSFPREDISVRESISQIALAIRDEVLDLEKNGIRVIQIDEAALREKLPLRKSDWYSEYLDFAIPAFRLVHSGVKPETQIHTHMCYSEFTDIIPAIDDMDADVITFEASRSDLQILDSLRDNHFETEVGPGVYDIHSPRVPSVEEIVAALEKMRTRIPDDKLWVNPDCGLKTRGETETKASLENLVEAARILRREAADRTAE